MIWPDLIVNRIRTTAEAERRLFGDTGIPPPPIPIYSGYSSPMHGSIIGEGVHSD